MRAPLLALLAFAFPSLALAASALPYAECAPYTVKALQEGRVGDVAALFSAPGKGPGASQAEISTQLSKMLGEVGALSDSKRITGMMPIATIKLEARDPAGSKDSDKFAQATYTIQTVNKGVILLQVGYHLGQADCQLRTVDFQILSPDSMASITYSTIEKKTFDALGALLTEKNIAYTVSISETEGIKVPQWKLETVAFPVTSIPAAKELHDLINKTTANKQGSLAFSSSRSGKPHTNP
jgi:hypothetical protein